MDHSSDNFSQLIKAKASELGFGACGISQARLLEEERERLKNWLDAGYHGTMGYMANNFEKRVNPAELVEGAKSVVSVLLNYYTDQKQEDPKAPIISKYALGKDYHYVLKERLSKLLSYIQTELTPCEGRVFTDSAPLLEKALAREAGLGWVGKHTLLIHPKMGSFSFIGELVLDIELDYDEPFGNNLCGSCSRCMESCPTGAIIAPAILDANRCISYLTIETKEAVPESLTGNLSNRLVGCDICQQVCPWNGRATQNRVIEFQPKPELLRMTAEEWRRIDKPSYKKLFKGTAVERAGFDRIKKTLAHLFPLD
ncbi:MAG: tRNA epoxyqueuosine(34) reductase QueG [Prolixibacteraceae bacterium]|nr:tRNA epoxyqueuosine(34) reductase QueG [Prolixibacteraceae bacterium]